jgi:hypothetical protein
MGLWFRDDRLADWLEYFAIATDRAARLGRGYIAAVANLQERWRERLRDAGRSPRADAAAWAIIVGHEVLFDTK